MELLTNAEMAKGPSGNVNESLEEMEKRKNSSAYYIPRLITGSAMFYNNRVYHGIAPVTNGTKYSLLFFLDQPPKPEDLRTTLGDEIFENPPDEFASMVAEMENCQGNDDDATVAFFHVTKEDVDRYGLADDDEADGLHLAWVDGDNHVIDGGFEVEQQPNESGNDAKVFEARAARNTFIGHRFALVLKKGDIIDTLKEWHIKECFQEFYSSNEPPPPIEKYEDETLRDDGGCEEEL